jgi:hypothetical protein
MAVPAASGVPLMSGQKRCRRRKNFQGTNMSCQLAPLGVGVVFLLFVVYVAVVVAKQTET